MPARSIKAKFTTDLGVVSRTGDTPISGNLLVGDLSIESAELGYLDGVTTNVQDQLDLKAPLASPALTGTPTAPTAAAGTNSTQIATTAFVNTAVTNVIDAAPAALDTLNELAAALGDDANYASTVTNALATKAPLASPALTGSPTAPTAAASTNTTQIATTAFVVGQAGTATPVMNGTATVGTSLLYARQDHVHATDTSRAPLASPVFTGTATLVGVKETKVAMAANAIDLATGTFFTKTISAATTFTVSNVPASGLVGSFILELTNAGSQTITWFSGAKWAGGTAPTLTSSGVDILGFYTTDGGTTWRGLVLAKDSK